MQDVNSERMIRYVGHLETPELESVASNDKLNADDIRERKHVRYYSLIGC